MVVEVAGPEGPVQLTLGITPQHISTLHTQKVAVSYRERAAAVSAHPPTDLQA
jgi:flagellar protein FliO/FliZ